MDPHDSSIWLTLSSACRPLFFYFMVPPVRELSVSTYRPDDATCARQIQNAMLNLIPPFQRENFILAGCVALKSIRFQLRLKIIQRGRTRDNKWSGRRRTWIGTSSWCSGSWVGQRAKNQSDVKRGIDASSPETTQAEELSRATHRI